MKEKVYLVYKGKRSIEMLGYNPITKEYVYYHNRVEVARWHGEKELFDLQNQVRKSDPYANHGLTMSSEALLEYSKLLHNLEINTDFQHYYNLVEKEYDKDMQASKR